MPELTASPTTPTRINRLFAFDSLVLKSSSQPFGACIELSVYEGISSGSTDEDEDDEAALDDDDRALDEDDEGRALDDEDGAEPVLLELDDPAPLGGTTLEVLEPDLLMTYTI